MAAASRTALALALLLPACGPRESVEEARSRVIEASLQQQLGEMRALIARAEAGGLATQDRIAIGIAEGTARSLLNVSLPREQLVGDRVYVRVETAEPYFRGSTAAVLFQATARGKATGATARIELAGRLANYRLDDGTLTASIELVHFKLLESSLGEMTNDVLDRLMRDHLPALNTMIPRLDIPVHLEQSIRVPGLDAGVVTARAGVLPLEMTLAEVIPVNQRLWILLEAKAGPWRRASAAGPAP